MATSDKVPSLRHKFTSAVVLAALLPAAMLGAFDQISQFRTQQKLLRERAEVAAALSASSVNGFLQAHLAGVRLSARMGPETEDWSGQLGELRQSYPAILTALAADAQGRVLATHPAPPTGGPSFGVADRPYFTVPRDSSREYVSDAFVGRRLGNDHLIAISAPMLEEGRFAGVVEASIPVGAFTPLRNSLVRRRGLEILLVDRNQRVINASAGLPYQFMDRVEPHLLAVQQLNGQPATTARRVRVAGTTYWASNARLASGWTLLIFASEDEIWTLAKQRLGATIGVLTLVSLGVWLAYAWQMRRFDEAQQRLIVVLNGLADGRAGEGRGADVLPVEFQPLGQAIEVLSTQLDEANEGLERSLNEQRSLSLNLQRSLEQREQEVAARTSELRLANAELDRLTRIDPLTGCLNRRGLEHEMSAMADDMGCLHVPIYVIAIDIDSFKSYNDGYGHAAGDLAIRRVSQVIKNIIAEEEVFVTRMGGEEFLLVGNDSGQRGWLYEIAERIRAAVEVSKIPHAGSAWGHVTVSLGCATGMVGTDYAATVFAADEALYRAKARGRNRVEI